MTSIGDTAQGTSPTRRGARLAAAVGLLTLSLSGCAGGGTPAEGEHGGEANLKLPDLGLANFNGVNGRLLLYIGILVCVGGLVFGVVSYMSLRKLPVHASMREISELIYETCKAYLLQQGKFLLLLWAFIASVMFVYYQFLIQLGIGRVLIVLAFSLIGMAGSYGIAWYGIRLNTFANSRTSFAALKGKPYACYDVPIRSGMSIGMVLISVELFMMLFIMLFLPSDIAGACFIGFAIGESLGASALRIAGGIFTKIADIGADLMKIVFKIKEDDARNPGVIADCTGDNAGDSVGPSADGFETYGVTGVALITFIILAVGTEALQAKLIVWIFFIRVIMVIASWASFAINQAVAKARWADADKMDFERPLTSLVWLTSLVSIVLTYLTSFLMIGGAEPLAGDASMWWKLATIISCGTIAGALIPELVKVFTSTKAKHSKGGPSLDILSGLVAGNFSAYWLGIAIMGLMGGAYLISTTIPDASVVEGAMVSFPAVFAFGLVAFGFLGMGPVTIAVDSYGPVTDNAQSVFELSTIEETPGIDDELERDYGFRPQFGKAKHFLEENDGAGNTFKATAKPVLIGTAVVGATTMIFSIIIGLTGGLTSDIENLSIMHAPFLLGLITGGAIIYWFSGASVQAVTTGAYRAVEFIKRTIRLEPGQERASDADSRKVVEICTQYAQQGMLQIFLAVFFATMSFAFVEPYFFIGYLISIAIFGLYQAIYMANAGGAWDNAKKVVEVDLHAKGTALHDATIVGDTVGDPFKDTSSVALNPIIKFTTLFGLLAVELAVSLTGQGMGTLVHVLAVAFFLTAAFFIHRSFYGMRIRTSISEDEDDTTSEPMGVTS